MLTERKLRQIIRKHILNEMGRFDPMLNKMADIRSEVPEPNKQQERASKFKSDLGITSDKSVSKEEIKTNLMILADLLGWQNFDPETADAEAINNLISYAIERTR